MTLTFEYSNEGERINPSSSMCQHT